MSARLPVLPTLKLPEVKVGDLLFCARPGALQELCDRAAGGWRHVGIVADVAIDGEPVRSIVEIGGDCVQSRPIGDLLPAYERVGVARLSEAHSGCAVGAARLAATWIDEPLRYSWDGTIAAGFVSWTRLSSGRLRGAWARRTADRIGRQPIPGGQVRTLTCSSFILEVFERSTRCGFRFTSGSPSSDVRPYRTLRTNGVTRIDRQQAARLARYSATLPFAVPAAPSVDELPFSLITPGDIWEAPSIVSRWYLGTTPGSDDLVDDPSIWWR